MDVSEKLYIYRRENDGVHGHKPVQWVPKTQRFAISNSVPEYEKWISVHTSGGTLNTRIGAQDRCVSLQIGPRCVLLLASKARSIKMQRALLRVCLPGCAARHRLRA